MFTDDELVLLNYIVQNGQSPLCDRETLLSIEQKLRKENKRISRDRMKERALKKIDEVYPLKTFDNYQGVTFVILPTLKIPRHYKEKNQYLKDLLNFIPEDILEEINFL